MSLPGWLPPMALVNPWNEQTFDALYRIFREDFIESRPIYEGHPVWIFPDVEDGKEVIFWHLTHRLDRAAGERIPDLRRCERLPWVRPLIDNSIEPEVLAWDYEEGDGSVKTYVWLENHDFLALMKKYANGTRRLLTSFFIDYPRYSDKLRKKYAKRIK